MKTPREILIERHQSAEPKLDALRRDVLKSLSPNENRRTDGFMSLVAAFFELFRLPRWAWSGLAAAWIVIIALNIAAGEAASTPMASSAAAKRSSDTLQALREQKQLFAELVGLRSENPEADAPRFVPRPRSERVVATACA